MPIEEWWDSFSCRRFAVTMFDMRSRELLNFVLDFIDTLRAKKVWFCVELHQTGDIA